ncbi:MAG: TOBE domain-containing protein, partial [Pseudomonadota bacterium]|nr:TOBE domain-containing protein [Pseudomonadota bacterium]
VEPAGADTFVLLNLSSKEVTARLKAETPVQPGQEMEFAFNMDKVSYFDVDSGERIN